MRAARIEVFGHKDVIKIVDIPKPSPPKGQVLIEAYASSINPFDTAVREGFTQKSFPVQLPITLGGDIAGVVREIGEGVSGISIGEMVYGQANVVAGNSGAFAEFAITSAEQIAQAPKTISIIEAATLPLVGVSAVQAITEHLAIQSGERLFIHGGAGGIGSIAIQIAKHLGAYVAATATDEGITYVKDLGADEVIDYKTQQFTELLENYDAVFDTVGGDSFAAALAILKPAGRAVSMTAHVDEAVSKQYAVTAITQSTGVTTERLNKLREFVEQGIVTPHIDKTFTLDEIQDAFEARESGSVKGKVALVIKN